MKRLLSFVLSAVMLVTALSSFSLTAFATTKGGVKEYKVGDKFTLSLTVNKSNDYESTDWKHAYYAKFVAPDDGDYEFAVTGEDFYGQGGYQALIVDGKDNVVSYAYALGEDSYEIDLVGHLKKGKTYYYLVKYFADDKHTVKLKVHLKKHKHVMIDPTETCPDAEHLIDYGADSDEPISICKIQGCFDDGVSVYYNIYSVQLTKTSYTYDGKEKKPNIAFYDMRGKKFTPDDVDVKIVYENNKNIGKAKAKVRTDGLWRTLTFKINPVGTSLKKLTSKRYSLTAKWTKQTSKTSGYQVQYSTNKSFKNAKKVTVKGNKNSSRTIKKLKRHKRYYVRVRTYKTVDGKKYYSSWSEAKSVKTK